MKITCPKCGSEEFYYSENATNLFEIETIHPDGHVDLGALVETYPDDHGAYLVCEDCNAELTVGDYYLALSEVNKCDP
jgi:hypothetical protein